MELPKDDISFLTAEKYFEEETNNPDSMKTTQKCKMSWLKGMSLTWRL